MSESTTESHTIEIDATKSVDGTLRDVWQRRDSGPRGMRFLGENRTVSLLRREDLCNVGVQYRVRSSPDELDQTGDRTAFAKLADVRVGHLNSSTKPHEIWRDIQIRLDSLNSPFPETLVRGELVLHVDVRWPVAQPLRLAGVLKPMFDGIVSALHRPRTVDARTIEMTADQMGKDCTTVRRWLTRTGPAVLSERAPVEPYRGGVRWNPDDSRLRAGRVLVHRFDASEPISLDISLYADLR